MVALIEPVWAPDGAGWQSWPPVTMPLEAASRVSGASSVAGGQMATVQRGGAPAVRSPASFSTSPSEAASPFIFQLPAISGVIVDVTECSRLPLLLPLGALCPNPAGRCPRGGGCLAARERPCLVSAALATP